MDAEPITTNPDGSAGLDPIQGPHAERIAQIFREHNQSLLQFLAGRLASEQDAKEVAQEAYVRVLQLDKPEGVSFLRAFLFKTAANLAAAPRKRTSTTSSTCSSSRRPNRESPAPKTQPSPLRPSASCRRGIAQPSC
jgi:RNA polymerase sigma-70 factor (ECF subfamily)